MKLLIPESGEVLAERVFEAHSFWNRLKGLMLTKKLEPGCCLHLAPCRSIHTYFMRYSIDVLYLDRHNRIVGMEPELKPGRVGTVFHGAVSVVELPMGSIRLTKPQIGQAVQFI